MSWMSEIFWGTGLKMLQICMFYIVFEFKKRAHISTTRYVIEMGFGSKWSILNGQVVYIETPKLNIANLLLIPLDPVTFLFYFDSNYFGGVWDWMEMITSLWPRRLEKMLYCPKRFAMILQFRLSNWPFLKVARS